MAALAGSSPPPHLSQKPTPGSYWGDYGLLMKTWAQVLRGGTGQGWHGYEPDGCGTCQPSQLQPEVGNPVSPSNRVGLEALVSAWLFLSLALALLGDSPVSNHHGSEEASQDVGHRSALTAHADLSLATAKSRQLETMSLVSPTNRNQGKKEQKPQSVGSRLSPTCLVNNKPTANI